MQYLVLANKSDLINERKVTKEDIEEKEIRLGIKIYESSTLENKNIAEPVIELIEIIYKSIYSNSNNPINDKGVSGTPGTLGLTNSGIEIEKNGNSMSRSFSKCIK
jgi:hypothetical protein